MSVIVEIKFNKLPALRAAAKQRAEAAIAKAAYDVEGQAKAVVPIDTGNLKNSIQATPEDELSWLVGSRNVEYSFAVEYGIEGTRRRPKPYMRPAAEKVRPGFIAAMQDIADTGGL